MVKTPLFPLYSTTSTLLKILEGESVERFKHMWDRVWDLRGTPQNTVDWTDPDEWINSRLSGDTKSMAEKIWYKAKINPRWTRGVQFLMSGYNLIEDVNGKYKLSDAGKIFVGGIENNVRKEIDEKEGLMQLLYQASVIGNGKRADFIDEWKHYLETHSNVKQESVIKDYMRRRLVNLADRGYLERKSVFYEITPSGLAYLKQQSPQKVDKTISKVTELRNAVDAFKKEQRAQIRKILENITPVQFEHLVKDLLNEMGYYDVIVTSPTNDKGVDVTAMIQYGISTIKEVIQVKRFTKGNVSRTVLDQLRGSLHRFDAFQGTIITLSDFAKGAKDAAFEKGAAPITLIDGNKLIDLLIENNLLIERKHFDYYIIKENYFNKDEENDTETE